MKRLVPCIAALAALPACSQLATVGRAPSFTKVDAPEKSAIYSFPMPREEDPKGSTRSASLWTANPQSLFGDRRAHSRGDILTVVIQIDDKAEISNTTGQSRKGSTSMGLPQFFGVPQRLDRHLPSGASMANAVSSNGDSSYQGSGSVKRNEKLTLRMAATVTQVLPNSVLRIEGSQEVRVNHELRNLVVSGYIRADDITRKNEITYDKIAGARISYGGRGQISNVQQPRIGQQIADIVLPF